MNLPVLPDGSINSGEMTSFNYYAFGAVADWLHRTIGGMRPEEPGYRRMSIRPRRGGGLTHAQVRHLTPYGTVESAWKIKDRMFDLSVLVPPNTTALVTLPGGDMSPIKVDSGSWHWSVPYQDPDVRGPYTVDDLIGDITYDTAAAMLSWMSFSRWEPPNFSWGYCRAGAVLLCARLYSCSQIMKKP